MKGDQLIFLAVSNEGLDFAMATNVDTGCLNEVQLKYWALCSGVSTFIKHEPVVGESSFGVWDGACDFQFRKLLVYFKQGHRLFFSSGQRESSSTLRAWANRLKRGPKNYVTNMSCAVMGRKGVFLCI